MLDDRIGHAALLLASAGAAGAADRLVTCWRTRADRPLDGLASGVRARAWAMLFEARGERPSWSDELSPLDLDAEERAHTTALSRPRSDLEGVLGESPVAAVVGELAGKLSPPRPDKLRTALARADLDGWATIARTQARPVVALLAATRSLAPLLVAGADPLGLGPEWPEECAGALIAALDERYPVSTGSWAELISEIARLRAPGPRLPAPASPADVDAAEIRLGLRLPEDYREFLTTCDGLPADVVFPRLLPAAELRAEGGVVLIAEPATVLLTTTGTEWRTVEVDPVLGTGVHPTFRALLEHHLRLLGRSV